MSAAPPVIFNLQRFCLHDGPGIRTTVFFKGCPLRCQWCHNPESQRFTAELLLDREKCSGCQRCLSSCPTAATQAANARMEINRQLCTACGKCIDRCLQDARAIAGHSRFTVADLLQELIKDQVFYEESGGGVTFSGGEALCQPDVLATLAQACKERGLHVAVDTCGHVPFSAFERVLPWVDLFLYDLKHLDAAKHQLYTGQDNGLILANLERLATTTANISLRLPLIETVNSDLGHIDAVIAYLQTLPIRQVHLLPYHTTGLSKLARLDRTPSPGALRAPSPECLEEIRRRFVAAGFAAQIGG